VVQKRPGWRYRRDYTRARELRHRGRLEDALALVEASLTALPESHFDWCPTVEEHVLLLTQLGRTDEAIERGKAYAERARQLQVPTAWLDLAIALCLAERGLHAEAKHEWQAAYDALETRDIGGVHLGYAHEIAARIARRRGDGAGFEAHARECEKLYEAGGYPALRAKYLRLVENASAGGSVRVGPRREEVRADVDADADGIRSAFDSATSVGERAERALALLCEHTGTRHGILFGMRAGRLQPATGSEQLEEGALELAEAYLSAEIESSLDATRTQMDDVATAAGVALGSRVASRYVPVVLRSMADQEERIVGIVLLLHDGPGVRLPAPSFVATLSDQLLRYGVFDGVRAAA